MTTTRALMLSCVLALLLGAASAPVMRALEAGPALALVPVGIGAVLAALPYLVAEVRRSERESNTPPR